jgi:2-dehydro-3-deoxygalactonokinase
MNVLRDSTRYVLGDWGTTRLRLFLLERDAIVATREAAGIGSLPASPHQVLIDSLTPWRRTNEPLDVYLAGMVGSRNGLHEVPYIPLPADCVAWSRTCWSGSLDGVTVTIAAGLCSTCGTQDVMRGEETQIFGALRLDETLASGRRVFVLPGTHSKWVELEDGRILRFRTALTGETYALLREHSTLLRASASRDEPEDPQQGFEAGVRRAADLAEGLLAAVFEARVQQLLAGRSRAWAAGFLSGLLIAYEIDTLGRTFHPEHGLILIGDPQLASLYAHALHARNRSSRVLSGDTCTIEGLRFLADCLRIPQ